VTHPLLNRVWIHYLQWGNQEREDHLMRPCKLSQRHCVQCFGTSKMVDSIPVIGLCVFFPSLLLCVAFVSLVVVVVVVVVVVEEEEEEVHRPRLYLLCFQKQKTYASWGRGARQIDRHSPFSPTLLENRDKAFVDLKQIQHL
jgi:hypothetical protein